VAVGAASGTSQEVVRPASARRLSLAALGPGLLGMAGDNDAGGLLAYAATGLRFGAALFVPLLAPLGLVAWVCQDMALRVGAATGQGLGSLLRGHVPRFWRLVAALDLALADWLMLVTEFAGMGLGLAHFGVPLALAIPGSYALALALLLLPSYRVTERLGVVLAVVSLLFVPLALAALLRAHGSSPRPARPAPGLPFYVLALVGNALSPWMPFFQAEATAARARRAESAPETLVRQGRGDLALGIFVQVLVAAAAVVVGAAGGARAGLAGDVFAVGIFDAGLVATLTVSLSTAWAVVGLLGGPEAPERAPAPARRRLALGYALALGTAATAALVPHLPLDLVAVGVQAASGLLLPPVFALLWALARDRRLVGGLANRPLENALAGMVLAAVAASSTWSLVSLL
jgi:Mn2+/Fe2+ NRAMP family transporter